ncbi:MAG: hypothetical protein KC442_18475, partial [Thermomicrobiales bacterium]|nr:hypothetical protein [Thermomicrobiales bacterium]
MPTQRSEFDAQFLDPLAAVPAVRRLGGTVRRDADGNPVRANGQHTIVYELRLPTGRITALRVHQRPDRERDRLLAQRYAALQSDHRLDPLRGPAGPLPRDILWLPEGIIVPDTQGARTTRPLVAMERVPGRTLRQTAARLSQERDAAHLALIADSWLAAALAMETVGFVHGDLSPDNLVVRPDGSIAVVDLDTASWAGFHLDSIDIDASATLQHPQGAPRDRTHRDRFAALMLWAELRVLAAQPGLQAAQQTEPAGLLFAASDLRQPEASPLFAHLDRDAAPWRLLLEVVRRAVRFSPDILPPLSEIATRLDSLGFPRDALRSPARRATARRPADAEPASRLTPRSDALQTASPSEIPPANAAQAAPLPVAPATPKPSAGEQEQRLAALRAALARGDGPEVRRLWIDLRDDPTGQIYAASVHQLTERDAHAAIDRALRRRDDAALLQAASQAEAAGVALTPHERAAAREARRRDAARAALNAALDADDRPALAELQRSGQVDELGPHDTATLRAVPRALAWPTLERALASDDDAAICAAADPALWREDETQPHATWLRLDLAWRRTRWVQDVRAALKRRDAPFLRGLLAAAPAGAEHRLTEIESRRVLRVITRDQATSRLERALREGADREVVEALAELEACGAPFSDVLDWSAVRGVVDRLSLTESLRDAMAANPPDTARMM